MAGEREPQQQILQTPAIVLYGGSNLDDAKRQEIADHLAALLGMLAEVRMVDHSLNRMYGDLPGDGSWYWAACNRVLTSGGLGLEDEVLEVESEVVAQHRREFDHRMAIHTAIWERTDPKDRSHLDLDLWGRDVPPPDRAQPPSEP